ncbi:COG2426 family protein [Halothermothrix orenii]|uniref:Putative small multi-drug export n=1 Tax=Halothermothrix orenii (strain H 168 / OCM 544 / DSM 9562) TaxID=373903 RepID=B8D1K0_HALOH|nr:small multi-drug export protein [Halothermothrix orenii]ACL69077.1 putative small multi-drug export [Halothermothrix orenii H 168]
MNEVFLWLDKYLSRELAVLITACLPFIELRGAIPLAISLGFSPIKAFWLGIIGNAIPVIPLLVLLEPVRKWLRRRFRFMNKFFSWLDERTLKKSDKVDKYGALGLILFTAVPLPTTGAWTASLAAILFKIKFRYAFPAIMVGILLAGCVVTLMSSVFL